MKIEICEQMVQSWLQHIKQCQIVQTNWMISPLHDISGQLPYIEWFMEDIAEKLNDAIDAEAKEAFALSAVKELADSYADAIYNQPEHPGEALDGMTYHFVALNQKETSALANIFGQSTPHQFVTQCEIDVVGIKFYNPTLHLGQNGVEKLYLIDSAFHKGTLGYGDAVARVLKKLIRACLVSYLVFGNQYPVEVAFATPDCTPGYEKKIVALVDLLRDLLKKHYSPQYDNIELKLYFNEDFANEIYNPLKENIDQLNNDNDLFMRALNLAKAAENRLATTSKTKKKAAKTPASSTTSAGVLANLEAKYTRGKMIEVAKVYLTNSIGLINLEKQEKLTENRGFEAQKILQALGIPTDGSFKGILNKCTIDDVIAKTTDLMLIQTLKEIKAAIP